MTASVTWNLELSAGPVWSITRAGYIICATERKIKMSLLQKLKKKSAVKDT